MSIIILDRDGVINYDSVNYIKGPDEWQPIPGSLEAIAALTKLNVKIGVATNQSGIARGLYTKEILDDIHAKMHALVAELGGQIDIVEYCPHLPDTGCDCRKPNPGMLMRIAQHFNVDLDGVPYLGDRPTDVEAAFKVNAKPILIRSAMTPYEMIESYVDMGVPIYETLKEAVDNFINNGLVF